MGPRDDLADFLRARRAAVAPGDVGLPAGPRRRAPGLRREEVAMLAGVSVTWYTWLEQGRDINVSRSVIDALARVLQLDEAEHDHLVVLASPVAARTIETLTTADVPDALVRFVEALAPAPAYVLGPRWEYLAWNDAQARLYPGIDTRADEDRNLLAIMFTDPEVRDLIVDWPDEARHMISQFRADTAARRGDAAVMRLVARLSDASTEFATWWSAQDVARFHTRLRRYRHATAGDLVFEYQQLTSAEWPELRVVCHLPVPDDDSAERLSAAQT